MSYEPHELYKAPVELPNNQFYDIIILGGDSLTLVEETLLCLKPNLKEFSIVIIDSTGILNLENFLKSNVKFKNIETLSIINESDVKRVSTNLYCHYGKSQINQVHIGSSFKATKIMDNKIFLDLYNNLQSTQRSSSYFSISKNLNYYDFLIQQWKSILPKILVEVTLVLFELKFPEELLSTKSCSLLLSGLTVELFKLMKKMGCKTINGYENEYNIIKIWTNRYPKLNNKFENINLCSLVYKFQMNQESEIKFLISHTLKVGQLHKVEMPFLMLIDYLINLYLNNHQEKLNLLKTSNEFSQTNFDFLSEKLKLNNDLNDLENKNNVNVNSISSSKKNELNLIEDDLMKKRKSLDILNEKIGKMESCLNGLELSYENKSRALDFKFKQQLNYFQYKMNEMNMDNKIINGNCVPNFQHLMNNQEVPNNQNYSNMHLSNSQIYSNMNSHNSQMNQEHANQDEISCPQKLSNPKQINNSEFYVDSQHENVERQVNGMPRNSNYFKDDGNFENDFDLSLLYKKDNSKSGSSDVCDSLDDIANIALYGSVLNGEISIDSFKKIQRSKGLTVSSLDNQEKLYTFNNPEKKNIDNGFQSQNEIDESRRFVNKQPQYCDQYNKGMEFQNGGYMRRHADDFQTQQHLQKNQLNHQNSASHVNPNFVNMPYKNPAYVCNDQIFYNQYNCYDPKLNPRFHHQSSSNKHLQQFKQTPNNLFVPKRKVVGIPSKYDQSQSLNLNGSQRCFLPQQQYLYPNLTSFNSQSGSNFSIEQRFRVNSKKMNNNLFMSMSNGVFDKPEIYPRSMTNNSSFLQRKSVSNFVSPSNSLQKRSNNLYGLGQNINGLSLQNEGFSSTKSSDSVFSQGSKKIDKENEMIKSNFVSKENAGSTSSVSSLSMSNSTPSIKNSFRTNMGLTFNNEMHEMIEPKMLNKKIADENSDREVINVT